MKRFRILREISKYAATDEKEKFDLIFIDSGHSFEGCVSDIFNCRKLAHKHTILWIDDYAPSGKSPIDFCVQEGLITLLNVKSANDSSEHRAWAIAKYQRPELEKVFSNIYECGIWGRDEQGQVTSGPGSSLAQGKPFIEYLQQFLDSTPDIQSVVDVGCGDWVLAREVNWGDRDYTGIDVVDTLISTNQSLFGSANIHFVHLDATAAAIPSGDLVICKDVLMHLPHSLIFNLLVKFKPFKYWILVNDIDALSQTPNKDIEIGGFRCLNLTASPFLLQSKAISYYYSEIALKQVLLIENFPKAN